MDKLPLPALAALSETIDDFLWERGIDRSGVLDEALREFLLEVLDIEVSGADA